VNDEDLKIENILDNNKKKKKKVDGKNKGDRTELNLCKLLTEYFGEEFSRALGSGSRWSQVGQLPEHAKKTLTGDVCAPEGFKWIIECKGGYEKDMNLSNVCDGKISRLDEFIEQVERDAEYCKRKPIILWKRNRKPWIAMLKLTDSGGIVPFNDHYIQYGKWCIVSFDTLLEKTDRRFWFE